MAPKPKMEEQGREMANLMSLDTGSKIYKTILPFKGGHFKFESDKNSAILIAKPLPPQ